MKKILTLQTGIVLIIAILVAGGCGNSKKQSDSSKDENGSTEEAAVLSFAEDDPTTVFIYLKDTTIAGNERLLMHDSKKPDDKVVDSLETVVNRGDTVIFKKAHKSEVKEVINVIPVETEYLGIFSEATRQDTGLYVLIINPESPDSIIVKYEIYFKVKKDTTTHYIDPYLKIPPQDPPN